MLSESDNSKAERQLLPFTGNGKVNEQHENWTVLHRPLSDRCHDVTHVLSQLFPELLSRQPSIEGRHTGGREQDAAGHGNFDLATRYVGELQKLNDELQRNAQTVGPQLGSFLPTLERGRINMPTRKVEAPPYSLPTVSFTKRKASHGPISTNPPALTQDGPILRDTAAVKVTKNNKEIAERHFKHQQAKHNYLKNPRTASCGRVMASRHCNEAPCFVVEPPEVLFMFDKLHTTYKSHVSVKNVSGVSQSFRLKQPVSSQFSIKLVDVFIAASSCVAPGMSIRCQVSFTADKVNEYKDRLVVVFGNGDSNLSVSLKAIAQPVQLHWSGGDELDCGYCLPGGSCRKMFTCSNEGTAGMFEIVTTEQWSSRSWPCQGESEIGSVRQDSLLSLTPFTISPARFYLKHKECQELQVSFSPQAVGVHHSEAFIAFNKLQALPMLLSGTAEDAVVELSSRTKSGAWSVQCSIADPDTQATLTMPDVNPYHWSKQEVTLLNCSNVDLRFSWCFVKSEDEKNAIQLSDFGVNEEASTLASSKSDLASSASFKFHPSDGQLPARGEQTLLFQYHPKVAGEHTVEVRLFVEGRRRQRNGSVTKQQVLALRLDLCAQPYKVLVEPQALVLAGPILIGKEVRISFMVSNKSLSGVELCWKSQSDRHSLSVEPARATMDVDALLACEAILRADVCKCVEEVLSCNITYSDIPVTLPVLVKSVMGAEVTMDLPFVDFGLVQVGKKKHVMLPLRNLSPVDTHFCIRDCGEPGLGSCLTIVPNHDTIPALGVCTAIATFHAQDDGMKEISTFLECCAADGTPSYVRVEGMVGVVQACLRPTSLEVPLVARVTETVEVCVINLSRLSSAFVWSQVSKNEDLCDVRVSPTTGVLAGGSSVNVKLSLTAAKQFEDAQVIMACEVKGMDKPLVLAVQTSASGPSVSCDKKRVEFGECAIGMPVSAGFQLTNNTGLTSRLNCYVVNFPSGAGNHLGFLAFIRSKTVGLSEPAKAHLSRDFMQRVLSLRRGAAIVVDPCGEVLQGNGVLDVRLTAYSDTWGDYNDTLICEIDGQVVVKVSLHYKVVGCPLSFRIAASSENQHCATLSFGKHLADTPAIVRAVQITNSSACDIRVDFKLLLETPDEEEDKLVDVEVRLGDPFPPLAPDGQLMEREKAYGDKRLVGVMIVPHQGARLNGPFSLREKQVLVPAYGCASGSVTFHPSLCPAGDCVALLKGYLSVDAPQQDHAQRVDGYEVTEMSLRLLAGREEAGVHIGDMDDEPWTVTADTILSHPNGKMLQRAIIISNTTPAVLDLRMTSTFPLIARATAEPDGVIVIQPHGRMAVCVGVKLTSSWLEAALQKANNCESHELPHYAVREEDSVLMCKGNLTVVHGTSEYVHSVNLAVHLPRLHASPTSIQFGPVRLGTTSNRQVILRNVSSSRASFAVSKVADGSGVWMIKPSSGVMAATLNEGSDIMSLLTVAFTPVHEGSYDDVIEITVSPGGGSLFLHLQGHGKISGV